MGRNGSKRLLLVEDDRALAELTASGPPADQIVKDSEAKMATVASAAFVADVH